MPSKGFAKLLRDFDALTLANSSAYEDLLDEEGPVLNNDEKGIFQQIKEQLQNNVDIEIKEQQDRERTPPPSDEPLDHLESTGNMPTPSGGSIDSTEPTEPSNQQGDTGDTTRPQSPQVGDKRPRAETNTRDEDLAAEPKKKRGRPAPEPKTLDEILELPILVAIPLDEDFTKLQISNFEEAGMSNEEYGMIRVKVHEILDERKEMKVDKTIKCFTSYFRASKAHAKCYRTYVVDRSKMQWQEGRTETAACDKCAKHKHPCFFFDVDKQALVLMPQVSASDWTMASSWL